MYTKNISRFLLKSSTVVKLFVLSLFITSCSDDSSSVIGDGHQYITFTVSTPFSSVPTYGISDDMENFVKSIDVLAFRVEGGREVYTYRAKGEEIQNVENTKKEFKVSLRKDEDIDYRFVVIANATDELDALTTTQTAEKSQLLARLLSKNAGMWNATSDSDFRSIPMWGETKNLLRITDAVKTISDIFLLRSLAAVDIAVSASAQSVFTLSEVYLYNRKTRGLITPYESRFDKTTMKVTEVSMPTDNPSEALTIWEGLKYTTSGGQLKNTLYTYESPAGTKDENATCIVVGGMYESKMTYYRLDFTKKENNSFKEFMALLRNHKYTMNITAVTDNGYDTPDEAFWGKKAGVTVDIEEWSMSDMAEVVVDQDYFLKVSSGSFSFTTGENFGKVTVQTNHPNGYRVSTENAWITITEVGSSTFKFRVSSMTGSREGKITVKVGNLTKDIKITQS